jgi:anti-anti-sigma regulatory factor
MNEHEKNTGIDEGLDALGVAAKDRLQARIPERDLVLDFSGIRKLDMANLSILLTAQQHAQEEDRSVWLAGIPLEIWRALHAMGLGAFFKPFPTSGELA